MRMNQQSVCVCVCVCVSILAKLLWVTELLAEIDADGLAVFSPLGKNDIISNMVA